MDYEYSEYERALLRRALTPAASSAGLAAQVNAINELFERNVPAPADRIRAELQAALGTKFGTDSEMRSHRMAERLLRVIDGLPEEEPTEEDRLADVVDQGWEDLLNGDYESADRNFAEFARATNFGPWQHNIDRDDERQRREASDEQDADATPARES